MQNAGLRSGTPSEPSARPHIFISLMDDLGFNDVGWRNPAIRTPFIDGLIRSKQERTIELMRHYTFPVCSPTRSSLLTGRLPSHVSQVNPRVVRCSKCAKLSASPRTPPEVGGVDVRMQLLPELLRKAGYRTAHFGKWHLGSMQPGSLPTRRGFDTALSMLGGFASHNEHTHTDCSHPAINKSRFVDLWADEQLVHPRTYEATHSCPLFAGKAVAHIEAHDAAAPLFLFLAWTEAHGPYDAPPSAFLGESNESRSLSSDVRNYRGMISCCDAGTANISAALKRKGMWNTTLMLWASDNGAVARGGETTGSNHPFRGGKGQMFEGGVRTVAFLAGGAVPRGAPRRFEHPMHVCDWFATFAHVAGVDAKVMAHAGKPKGDSSERIPMKIDSINAWPALTSEAPSSPRSEVLLGTSKVACWHAALISGNLKVVHKPSWDEDDPGCLGKADVEARFLLFNLTSDPAEEHDLAVTSAAWATVRDEMVARLTELAQDEFQSSDVEELDATAPECKPAGFEPGSYS